MRKSCQQCRALLPGYVERELSLAQRACVSQHLSVCAECHVAYIEQRQLVQELMVSVPRIGSALLAAQPPRLERIRAAVMAEMETPAKPKMRIHQARYSLAALILVMALLLPWSMRNRPFALPTPPQPETLTPQGTAVVAALPPATATLTATLQSNYAPVLGATETP
jgi:hypothetical protein